MIEAIAKEFITLHTEEFNLENYIPKGQLEGFPKEIIALMLEYQVEQGNKRNISAFEKDNSCSLVEGGFDWDKTKENGYFWYEVISNKNFNVFFEKYPKQDNQYNSQEFKVGDKVIDIIRGRIGKVTYIETLNKDDSHPITVNFNDEGLYFTLNGRHYVTDKHPRLLHYRDDYNYDIIDFNNLPQRQEVKRWRAEKGESYYFIKRDEHDFNLDNIYRSIDYYNYFSNELYKIGNYFQTKEEAQKIVDQTNTYFQKIVKI